ncbi:unnamed protein product [Plutella xylostella]|uniref:(diamondback moth) hypothetical protein n=1 Tax=Plutella xylostella TaxID=51655 RepID=A0A8S4DHI0_PLUXY|nr:unnamed protein product [Plutella xylostella]
MDIMNNEFKMPKDLRQMAISAFRQDPKLTVAIDKLQAHSNMADSNEKRNFGLVLPDRKLNFQEVRQLLSRTDETIKDKSPDILLKEQNDTRKSLLKKVEDILDNINRAAENKETPKLIIRNQRLWSNCIYDFDRELFYQNVTRIRSQSYLDLAVRDACCLLETPPWSLGIAATAKGLVAGPLTMETAGGKRVDCMGAGGVLVPQDISGIKSFATTAKYILVVEKDAIFQKLLDEGALARLGPVIILTGKGYPDVCSRRLLRRLSRELRLRALALVDPDPHGMEIFLTYKYGSLAQSHLSSSLACPSLALLGARHSDVMTLAPAEARMRLTDLDRRKLNSLLKRPYLDNAAGAAIKEELKSMLSSGVKAELEALAPTTAALCDAYLTSKLIQGDYLG